MNTLLKRFGSKHSLGMMALLGLAALAGSGPLAFGQDTVRGKLTLPVEARLGNTVLPPGEYKLNVALLGTTLSVNSIQDVYTPVMVMVTPLTKGGPMPAFWRWPSNRICATRKPWISNRTAPEERSTPSLWTI